MRLLVIIPDNLPALIRKGEVTRCYYNPGNHFDEVHLVMLNDQRADPAEVQPMAGAAQLFLHNLPPPSFRRSLGWQPALLRPWIEQGIALARHIAPHMVRTYNNFLEGFLAAEIKQRLRVPLVVSVHGVWDRDWDYLRPRFLRLFRKRFEIAALRAADGVIAVYQPIVRYARAHGARRVELIYNIVAGQNLSPKRDYRLSSPPRLVTINRQLKEKNPEQIIRAVSRLDCHYLIVGNGEYHERLKAVAVAEGCANRVEFVQAIPNEKLCGMLKDFDLHVSHCDYWGISKSLIEAALCGLPTVLNHHPTEPLPDCQGGWLSLCDNTPEGYQAAIQALLGDEAARQALGERALRHAAENFSPQRMEEKTIGLYRDVLAGRSG